MSRSPYPTAVGVALVTSLVVSVLVAWIAQSSPLQAQLPITIRAHSFELIDVHGNMRGMWRALPSGPVGLVMISPDGETRSVELSVTPDGDANLVFFDKTGKTSWTARDAETALP